MNNQDLSPLTLSIVSSEKAFPLIYCDSVILTVQDNKDGKGGGSYGIRKGHAKALIATAEGTVTAKKDGEVIFSAIVGSGFAVIDSNHITVTSHKG